MVAAILSHAALPTGSALQRGAGSAFSVTTSEVTTIPRRDRAKQRVETEHRGDPEAGLTVESAVAIAPIYPAADLLIREQSGRVAATATAPPDYPVYTLFQARAPPVLLSAMA